MFSRGICIMSAVHRQRSCSAPVPPLVIYLAALLKCSCRWHWLTNQTVKTHPEYQSTAVLLFSCCCGVFFGGCGGGKKYLSSTNPNHFWTTFCSNQVDEIDFFFVLPGGGRTSPRTFLGFVRGHKPKRKEAAALDFFCVEQTSAQEFLL